MLTYPKRTTLGGKAAPTSFKACGNFCDADSKNHSWCPGLGTPETETRNTKLLLNHGLNYSLAEEEVSRIFHPSSKEEERRK